VGSTGVPSPGVFGWNGSFGLLLDRSIGASSAELSSALVIVALGGGCECQGNVSGWRWAGRMLAGAVIGDLG